MTGVHRYTTRLAWSGSTADGYEGYTREHALGAPPAEQELRLSSDAARIDVLEYTDDAEGTMDESDEPARIQAVIE